MMKHALAAAISSAAILMASGAQADGGPEAPPPPPPPVYEAPPPQYNWYTTIFAGAAISPRLKNDVLFLDPVDPLLDVRVKFNTELKTGYLLGWTVGYRPMGLFGSSWFSIRPEAELSLRHANVDFKEILGIIDDDTILVDTNVLDRFANPADVLSLMFNGWLDFDFVGVHPYLGGGIGVGWSNFPAPGSFIPGFRSTKFAWQAGAGFNYDINDRVFVGIGYRYFRTSFKKDITVVLAGPIGEPLDTIVELDTPINFDLSFRTHEVLFNLGVRF